MIAAPLLSILIPSYEYPEGIERILEALAPVPSDVEIVVSDDSGDDGVERAIARTAGQIPIRYVRNRPALGAPGNWNALIALASGRYCWLLHHDDIPEKNCLAALLNRLRKTSPDVIVLDMVCLAGDRRTIHHRHMPLWIRKWVLGRRPGYLIRRNVVGPTSALLVRREMFPQFDIGLKWLVDVDAYTRLFAAGVSVQFVPVRVGFIAVRTGSITSSIRRDIPRLAETERERIRRASGIPDDNGPARVIEPLIWAVFRFLWLMWTRTHYSLTPQRLP